MTKEERIKEVAKHFEQIIRVYYPNGIPEGMTDTPMRVAKAYEKKLEGMFQNVQDIITVFDSEGYDQMVLLKDIEFYSTCEHHDLPFFGKAHVAYMPKGKIVGISKLARIVDIFTRRWQNQERATQDISYAIRYHLQTRSVGVVLEAQHLCMKCRGVMKQNSIMKTSALTGAFNENDRTRAEFFSLIAQAYA